MKKTREKILVFCAHNDDHIIGAGGTLAKYSREGKNIMVVIFSYGEASHFWMKEKFSIRMRVNESKKADKILGVKKTIYFGLKEGRFEEEIKEKKLVEKIKNIIDEQKPAKIFTHSIDDPHPDHQRVYSTILEASGKAKHRCDIYSFDIWNPVNIRKRNMPKLVVDISKTFRVKIKSLKYHKSQQVTILTLLWNVYRKDFFNGLNNNCKYAEVFCKVN